MSETIQSINGNANRLSDLINRPPSSNIQGYEYASQSLIALASAVLRQDEIEIITKFFPMWATSSEELNGNTYASMSRPIIDSNIIHDVHDMNGEPERRVIGLRNNTLVILTKHLKGSDFQLAAEIEHKLNDSFNSNEPTSEEPSTTSDEDTSIIPEGITQNQYQILASLYRPYGQLAIERGVSVGTIRSHTSSCMKLVGVSGAAELAVWAARHKLIDLNELPKGRTKLLSHRQAEVLREHYHETYKDGAAAMKVELTTYRSHWHGIFKKLEVVTQVQAVLLAVKDGLIPFEESDHEHY